MFKQSAKEVALYGKVEHLLALRVVVFHQRCHLQIQRAKHLDYKLVHVVVSANVHLLQERLDELHEFVLECASVSDEHLDNFFASVCDLDKHVSKRVATEIRQVDCESHDLFKREQHYVLLQQHGIVSLENDLVQLV